MDCSKLAKRIERLQPDAAPNDVARLCLLLMNSLSPEELQDDQRILDAWQEIGLRLQATSDQHSAVADELHVLCHEPPQQLEPNQVNVLIRALKVQNQVLQLYVNAAN